MSRFIRRSLEPQRTYLLDEIDTLALELREARQATAGGRVPLAARADYLRAHDAHRRAVIAFAAVIDAGELHSVADALGQCRAALESSRVRLERRPLGGQSSSG